MSIGQEAHESCTAEGLRVHLTKERRGGRKVNFFNSIPSVMLQLESLSKDSANLLPYEMLKFILIRFRKLNGAAILPGDKSQVFQVKIALDPFDVMGEQIEGPFALSFSPGMGKPVLPEPLFEKGGLKGPTPRCFAFP